MDVERKRLGFRIQLQAAELLAAYVVQSRLVSNLEFLEVNQQIH
jgi:hypothetical protein